MKTTKKHFISFFKYDSGLIHTDIYNIYYPPTGLTYTVLWAFYNTSLFKFGVVSHCLLE